MMMYFFAPHLVKISTDMVVNKIVVRFPPDGSTNQFFLNTQDPSYKKLNLKMEAEKGHFQQTAEGLKRVKAGKTQ